MNESQAVCREGRETAIEDEGERATSTRFVTFLNFALREIHFPRRLSLPLVLFTSTTKIVSQDERLGEWRGGGGEKKPF